MSENQIAKIIRSNKREFDCQLEGSKEEIKAVCLRELLKKDHIVVGDSVVVRPQTSDDRFEIIELIPRKNEIFRKIVRSNKKKVIASNIDSIVVVASVSKPVYKPFLVDRYLVRAEQWNIPAIVVFNKMDEFDDQFDIELEKKKFKKMGVQTFQISSVQGQTKELQELEDFLSEKTAICLGQSGVGKSKLISALSGGSIELLSARLAKGVDKGAHTTTWAELIDCNKFYIVDSPGVRSMAVIDIPIDELTGFFPDLVPYFEQCQFFDCRHEENSKGCAFRDLDPEDDDDFIVYGRLYSYIKMRDEIESIPEWKK